MSPSNKGGLQQQGGMQARRTGALVDSRKMPLEIQDIIGVALTNSKETYYAPAVAYTAIAKELSMPNTMPMIYGNTLFIVHPSERNNRFGYFRALNADTANNYLENSIEFVKGAYDAGFDVLVTQFSDPTILNIFKGISRNPPNEGMGYEAKKVSNGSYYNVTLKLGEPRGE